MKKGFSLLEVMVATVILAGMLISISRIISYSYLYNSKIRKIYLGTELAWLKLDEIKEKIKKDGIPDQQIEEEGEFEDDAYKGFKWKWEIKRVFLPLPTSLPSQNDNEEGEQSKTANMFMGASSMIEDFFKERIRKLILKVYWDGGKKESEKVTFTLFLTTKGTATQFRQQIKRGKKHRKLPGNFGRKPFSLEGIKGLRR
jgi:prepilin-type N-terminal cleavage/methylation domain-containing protein